MNANNLFSVLGENCTGYEDWCGQYLDGSECLDGVCTCTFDTMEANYQCMSSEFNKLTAVVID